MRKMLVVSAMGLLALGTEAVGARALPIPDAYRFTEHDIQAPRASTRSEVREIQAPRAAGDDFQAPLHDGDFQAPWLEDKIQTPRGQ
jgi:hypothetical protein